MSAEMSPDPIVSKSTRASSGSRRLTSISLVAPGIGLSVLRGVVGVFGREPSAFWEGETGAVGKLICWRLRGRSSALMYALYRFVGMRILGVVERDISSTEATEIGRLGVNGTVRF